MQDVRRCSRVTPTNPASKDNTAESINLHPPEILYVANLHVLLFAHRSLPFNRKSCNALSKYYLSLSFSIFLDWKLGLFGFIRYVLEAETAFATFRPLFLSLSFAKSDFNRSYSVFSTRTLLDLFIVPRLFISLVFSFVERAILVERSRKKYLKKKEDRRICSFLFIIEHFKGEKDLLFVFIYLFYFFFYLWEGEGNCKGLVFFQRWNDLHRNFSFLFISIEGKLVVE